MRIRTFPDDGTKAEHASTTKVPLPCADADVRPLPFNDFHQTGSDVAVDIDKALIARAVIVQHCLFYGTRGGQRAGRQQPGILSGFLSLCHPITS